MIIKNNNYLSWYFQVQDNNSVSALLHLSNSDFLTSDFLQLFVDGAKDFVKRKRKPKQLSVIPEEKIQETQGAGKKTSCYLQSTYD